jgi:glycosyltransferase involved in cell wall biosynthesis
MKRMIGKFIKSSPDEVVPQQSATSVPEVARAHVRISKATFDAGQGILHVNGWCLHAAVDFSLFLTVPGTSVVETLVPNTSPRDDVLKNYSGYDHIKKPGWAVNIPLENLPDNAEVHILYMDAEREARHHTAVRTVPDTKAETQSNQVFKPIVEKFEYSPLRSLGSVKLRCSALPREQDLALRTNHGRTISQEALSAHWRSQGKNYVADIRFPLAGVAAGEALEVKIEDECSDPFSVKVLDDSIRRTTALSPSIQKDVTVQPNQIGLEEIISLKREAALRPQSISPGSVCYFPMFDGSSSYSNHHYRASWYLGGGEEENEAVKRVTFGCGFQDVRCEDIPDAFDTGCLSPKECFEIVTDHDAYLDAVMSANMILIWRPVSKSQIESIKKILPGKQILSVATDDPTAAEYGSYCRAPWLLLDRASRGKILEASQDQFSRLLERERLAGKQTAAVFGTGPSIDKSLDFDFSHSMTVACNTIVASEELLDHLAPALITAGDAVSHFGVSQYAARYRRDLLRCLRDRDAYFLTSASMGYVLYARYPEFRDRILLCDQTHNGINTNLTEVWSLPRFDSTLNIHMLPAATSFSDTVYLLGFDGKNPDPDKNEDFWAHSQKAHYHDLVDTGHECHPTFSVNRSLSTSERYENSVEDSLSSAECCGKKFYCLLPSFTPSLSARPLPGHRLSLNPETGLKSFADQDANRFSFGKRGLVVMKSPRAHFSGGRYHATMLALAMGDFCDEVVVWSNNFSPWMNELNASPYAEKLNYVVNDFISIPEGRFDYIVAVPDLSDNVCKSVLQKAKEDDALTAFVNFESPNWFNAMSPDPRPLGDFVNWYSAGCFSDVILCSAETSIPFAKRFFENPLTQQIFEVATPAINDPIANLVVTRPPSRKKRITVFGRFGAVSAHKNLHSLLECLPNQLDGYTLSLIAGTSNVIDDAETELMEHGLRERGVELELLTMISDFDKFNVIASSELVLFPSLFEGFGYPPAEAAYVGTPCLMYDLPVLLENNSDHGYFVPVGDVHALRQKISEILGKPSDERLPSNRPEICDRVSQAALATALKSAFEAASEGETAHDAYSDDKFRAAQQIYSDMLRVEPMPFHALSNSELKEVIDLYRSKLFVINDAVDCLASRLRYQN